MSAIGCIDNLKLSGIYAVMTGATAAVGILGSRYISTLPKHPWEAALISGGSAFIIGFGGMCLDDFLTLRGVLSDFMSCLLIAGVIISGAGLAACSKVALSGKNVSIIKVTGMSFIENVAGFILAFAVVLILTAKSMLHLKIKA